jgi:hypothetical protein
MNLAMDNVIKYFDLQSVTQRWTTFSCIPSSVSWKVAQSNNFLSFFDYFQNQINKLAKANLINFLFSPSKRFVTLPLTSNQCDYF